MSDKAQAMINVLVAACIEFEREVEPIWQTRIDKAHRELREYIAKLEEKQRWIPVSERLPEANGWYLCGMVSFLGATFTNEIYFDAVNIDPRWNNPAQDRVYWWLDGVPELPEVQA